MRRANIEPASLHFETARVPLYLASHWLTLTARSFLNCGWLGRLTRSLQDLPQRHKDRTSEVPVHAEFYFERKQFMREHVKETPWMRVGSLLLST